MDIEWFVLCLSIESCNTLARAPEIRAVFTNSWIWRDRSLRLINVYAGLTFDSVEFLLLSSLACGSYLLCYLSVLFSLLASTVHKAGCRLRRYTFRRLYLVVSSDLFELLSETAQMVILWLKLFLLLFEYGYKLLTNLSLLFDSHTVLQDGRFTR